MKNNLFFILIISLFFITCRRPVQYSDIPEIKFISFDIHNQTDGMLTYYFQDGDGDIGLYEFETNPPFDFNFFCDCYEKRDGMFEKVIFPDTTFNLNARIPRLSDLSEESINGEIAHLMVPYRDNSPYDTVKLSFYIVDRKLNHSNVEEVIVVRNNN